MGLSADISAELTSDKFWFFGVLVALTVGVAANLTTDLLKVIVRIAVTKHPADATPYLSANAQRIFGMLTPVGILAAGALLVLMVERPPATRLTSTADIVLAVLVPFLSPMNMLTVCATMAIGGAASSVARAPTLSTLVTRYVAVVIFLTLFTAGTCLIAAHALAALLPRLHQ